MKEAGEGIIAIAFMAIISIAFYGFLRTQSILLSQQPKEIKSLAQLMPQRDCNEYKGSDKWANCMVGKHDE